MWTISPPSSSTGRASWAAKLGPILIQLGPDFGPTELPAVAQFLPKLPRDIRFAIEFRQRGWIHDGVLALLAEHNVALDVERRALDSAKADDAARHASDRRLPLRPLDGRRPEHRRLLAHPARSDARTRGVDAACCGRTPSRGGRCSAT